MRRTRAVGLTALAAVGALVISACSGTPGQQGASSSAAPAESSAAVSSSGATASSSGGAEASTPPGSENVGKVGGSGCGIPHGPYDEPATTGGDVRVSWNDPPLSFNNNTTHANATAAANIQYFTNTGFTYYDKDLTLINNDQFGTCEIISLDPLTVKYTVKEGVTYSDGTQVDAADMVLSWGAQSGVFNTEEAQTDDEGNLLPSAGVAFDKVDQSLSLITEFPEISEDGLSATFKWSEFYIDYQTASPVNNGAAGTLVPSHVVAAKALNITDPAAGKQAIIDAFKNKDQAALKPIADFWNTGFDADQLPSDPSLYLSTGPYKVTAYQQRASLTLERNEAYNWGPKPEFDKITYTIIGDPTAAVQALTNEETDVISPQATADIYQAVAGLADRGIDVATGDGGTYEHVDLVFANGGPFDPAKYGGDEAKALKVRQAFLKTIPRTEILDRLIKPINPEAVLRELVRPGPRRTRLRRGDGGERYERLRHGGHPRRAGASPGGRGGRSDRRPAALRGEQPAPVERIRPDEGLRGAGGLQPHRRAEPELGHAAADHFRVRRFPVRLEQHLDGTRRHQGELLDRRIQQLREVLECRGRLTPGQGQHAGAARGGVLLHDR